LEEEYDGDINFSTFVAQKGFLVEGVHAVANNNTCHADILHPIAIVLAKSNEFVSLFY